MKTFLHNWLHKDCQDSINKLTQENKLMLDLTHESKGVFDYTIHELEKKLKERESTIASLKEKISKKKEVTLVHPRVRAKSKTISFKADSCERRS